MINLIIEFKKQGANRRKKVDDFEDVIEELIQDLSVNYNFQYVEVPEMKDNTYLIVIKRGVDFRDLLVRLKRKRAVKVIGAYRKNGTQFKFKNADNSDDTEKNHSIKKYRKQLRNKKTYNNDGDVVEDREYTEEEAKSLQVNKIYGWNDRNLN